MNNINKEFIEFLQNELRDSKELTKSVKRDEDGFFQCSNNDLRRYCGIGSNSTLQSAIKKLVELGLIQTKRGSSKTGASWYKVNMDLINSYRDNPIQPKECSKNTPNKKFEDRIEELEARIEALDAKYEEALKLINAMSESLSN